MRPLLPLRLLGRPAPLAVNDVAELIADMLKPVREIDLVLYGSTVEAGRVVGDVDVWLAGPPKVVDAATLLLRTLATRHALPIDVARAGGEDPGLDAATRWCVSQ